MFCYWQYKSYGTLSRTIPSKFRLKEDRTLHLPVTDLNAHSALLEKLNSRNGDARNIENNDKCVLSLQFISNSSRSSRCFFAIPTTFKGGHGTQCHFEIACLTGHGNCREMHWEDQNARKVGKSDARAWRATHAL